MSSHPSRQGRKATSPRQPLECRIAGISTKADTPAERTQLCRQQQSSTTDPLSSAAFCTVTASCGRAAGEPTSRTHPDAAPGSSTLVPSPAGSARAANCAHMPRPISHCAGAGNGSATLCRHVSLSLPPPNGPRCTWFTRQSARPSTSRPRKTPPRTHLHPADRPDPPRRTGEAGEDAPTLPSASLAWSQGPEIAAHQACTVGTDLPVSSCEPANPWQRGSNEHTNGRLRQYSPKDTTSQYTPTSVWIPLRPELNSHPYKALGGEPQPSARLNCSPPPASDHVL